MNSDGTQYKGWLLLDNSYYYLLPKTGDDDRMADHRREMVLSETDGRMASEWLQDNGKWYYLLDGAMVTGWLRIGTDYYYLKGRRIHGHRDGGKWTARFITLPATDGWYADG